MGTIGDLVTLGLVAGIGYVALTWTSGTGEAVTGAMKQILPSNMGGDPPADKVTKAEETLQKYGLIDQLPDETKTALSATLGISDATKGLGPGGTLSSAVADAILKDPEGEKKTREFLDAAAFATNPVKTGEFLVNVAGNLGDKTAKGIGRAAESISNGTWEWTGFKAPWDW